MKKLFSEYLINYKPTKLQLEVAMMIDSGVNIKVAMPSRSGKTWLFNRYKEYLKLNNIDNKNLKEHFIFCDEEVS